MFPNCIHFAQKTGCHLCKADKYSIMYICHDIFIQSFVNGNWLIPYFSFCELIGYKHEGTDNFPMLISSPLDTFSGMEWLGHMIDLFLDPSGMSSLFSIMDVLVYTAINNGLVHLFPNILSNIFPLIYLHYALFWVYVFKFSDLLNSNICLIPISSFIPLQIL